METGIIVGLVYLSMACVAAVIVFSACAVVYHLLEMRKMKYEMVYKAGLISTAREEIQMLSDETIKSINDRLMKMAGFENEES